VKFKEIAVEGGGRGVRKDEPFFHSLGRGVRGKRKGLQPWKKENRIRHHPHFFQLVKPGRKGGKRETKGAPRKKK